MVNILSEEFAQAAATAGLCARQRALAAGQSVVFIDLQGRLVEELPDGRSFEIRLDPVQPRETHRIVVRELTLDPKA